SDELIEANHVAGIVHNDQRRIQKRPKTLAVVVLDLRAKAHAVRPSLPVHVVGELIAVQVSGLRRVDRVSKPQVAPVEPNLRSGKTYAADVIGRAMHRARNAFAVFDLLVVEPEVVDHRLSQDGGQAPDDVLILATVLTPVGRQRVVRIGSEHLIVVVAVSNKQIVLCRELWNVYSDVAQLSFVRAVEHGAELRNRG